MAGKKKIKIIPGGPYEVTGKVPIKNAIIEVNSEGTSMAWKEGTDYQNEKETVMLCRCGHSDDKPFCDGSHVGCNFEGEETADKKPYLEKAKAYEGEDLILLDCEEYCASMRFCDRGARAWTAAMKSSDPELRELAIQEAADCAAGRLTAATKDGKIIEPDLPEEISPVEDTAAGRRGPLWVKGGIELEGADGEMYETRNRMTLCRCGESRNMPYCDISHMQCEHMEGFDK